MKYLLDTHVLLWWLTEPHKLDKKAQHIIADIDTNIFISSASFWEMAIKQSVGKLHFPINMIQLVTQQEFEILPQ
jgi:PIN domain nuclease of toxin-antitoxin system